MQLEPVRMLIVRCSNETIVCVDSREIIVMRSLHRVDTNYIDPGPLGVKDQSNRTFTTCPSFGGARKHFLYVMNPSHFEVTETVVFLFFFPSVVWTDLSVPPFAWPAATFLFLLVFGS